MSLIDQAVVSGTSLFATVAIGRFTVPSQLGIYALVASLMIALQNTQNALIASPYTILRHRPAGTPQEHAGSALALCGLLAVLATIVMVVVALVVEFESNKPVLEAAVWALAVMSPFILIREFGRDYAFAHLQMGKILLLDLSVAAAQIATLGYLSWRGSLSPADALLAIGTAYGVTGLAWLYWDRGRFKVRVNQLPEALRQAWRLGRWILANQLSLVAQVNLSYWLIAAIGGTAATGIYAACMCVASLANPLVLGLSNVMFAQATVAFKEGGTARLKNSALHEGLLLGVAMTGFCLVILFAGEYVLQLFFTQQDYVGHGDVLVALALWQLAHAIGIPASNSLSAMERVRVNFYTGLAGTCIAALFITLLMMKWGLLGAAIGLLIGSACRSAMRWAVFLMTSDEAPTVSPASKAAASVVQKLAAGAGNEQFEIAQIDVGSEAHIFSVKSRPPQRLWPERRDVVIKLYKSDKECSSAAAEAQRETLLALHTAIHGVNVHGWKIRVARPLCVFDAPPALVMTMVPGRKLSACLESGDRLAAWEMESAASAIATAMQRCWSSMGFHGDLAFHNILCDVDTRELSFVDAGALTNCWVCDGIARNWSPAAHDLAHILCDVGANMKNLVVNRAAYGRAMEFSTNLMLACLEPVRSLEAKQALLDELRECARLHVRAIGVSGPRYGVWHAITRRVAQRRIDAILNRVQVCLARQKAESGSVVLDVGVATPGRSSATLVKSRSRESKHAVTCDRDAATTVV